MVYRFGNITAAPNKWNGRAVSVGLELLFDCWGHSVGTLILLCHLSDQYRITQQIVIRFQRAIQQRSVLTAIDRAKEKVTQNQQPTKR